MREGPVVAPVVGALRHPMENLPLHINLKSGPKLTDNILIPILTKGHKRKETPLVKLGNESINLRMIMILERIKLHMLVRKDRRLGATLTLLENHGEVVVVVEARPELCSTEGSLTRSYGFLVL